MLPRFSMYTNIDLILKKLYKEREGVHSNSRKEAFMYPLIYLMRSYMPQSVAGYGLQTGDQTVTGILLFNDLTELIDSFGHRSLRWKMIQLGEAYQGIICRMNLTEESLLYTQEESKPHIIKNVAPFFDPFLSDHRLPLFQIDCKNFYWVITSLD